MDSYHRHGVLKTTGSGSGKDLSDSFRLVCDDDDSAGQSPKNLAEARGPGVQVQVLSFARDPTASSGLHLERFPGPLAYTPRPMGTGGLT